VTRVHLVYRADQDRKGPRERVVGWVCLVFRDAGVSQGTVGPWVFKGMTVLLVDQDQMVPWVQRVSQVSPGLRVRRENSLTKTPSLD